MSIRWFRGALVALGALLIFSLAAAAILLVPTWLVDASEPGDITPSERLQSISSQRQIVLWVLGGCIAIVGLSYTHLRHSLDRDANRTDRFSTAIGQLADDKLEIRIGAKYALERIALDSRRERGPIMNVLCAFVRTRRARNFGDYVVLQVVLKEKLFGSGSGNLTELEKVINKQAALGYRLHTISTGHHRAPPGSVAATASRRRWWLSD